MNVIKRVEPLCIEPIVGTLSQRLIFAQSILLLLSGCAPLPVSMDSRSMALVILGCLVIILLQLLIIAALAAYHPRLRQVLIRQGLVEPQLAKTRHQLYSEIARHESTEELLRETQEYLQCIINSMPSVLIGVTAEGYVTHWNTAAEEATGLAADQALGVHINNAIPELPIDMPIIEQVVTNNLPYIRENVQKGRGSQASFTDLIVCPLVATEISGAVILAADVTRRVRLENMMIQNEKMMSLGELAAGLAHEINNPLAGILNNVQNILRRISSPLAANQTAAAEVGIDLEQVEDYLRRRQIIEFVDNIRLAGERAAHIVKNMLEFSHSSHSQRQTATDIPALVEQTLELASKTFELQASEWVELPHIERHYAPDLPLIVCSPTEIQQVILNLLRNAAQAFNNEEYGPPPEPRISIRVAADNDFVTIEIADNGPGMPDAVSKHIFEPFFTTKAVGQGTGLGLSVSYFIVTEHHRGAIEVHSQPGEGTSFLIKLPVQPIQAAAPDCSPATADGSRHPDRSTD